MNWSRVALLNLILSVTGARFSLRGLMSLTGPPLGVERRGKTNDFSARRAKSPAPPPLPSRAPPGAPEAGGHRAPGGGGGGRGVGDSLAPGGGEDELLPVPLLGQELED